MADMGQFIMAMIIMANTTMRRRCNMLPSVMIATITIMPFRACRRHDAAALTTTVTWPTAAADDVSTTT